MRMVGKSRAKMFQLPPRDNLQYQLDVMSEESRETSLETKNPMVQILQILVYSVPCKGCMDSILCRNTR